MTEQEQIYKCNVCGNIVEVLHAGVGQLVCCGQSMELLKGRTEDVGQEKHVPVIEKTETGIKVKVGSVPHPMEEKHYIEWIEIIADGNVYSVCFSSNTIKYDLSGGNSTPGSSTVYSTTSPNRMAGVQALNGNIYIAPDTNSTSMLVLDISANMSLSNMANMVLSPYLKTEKI